MCLRFQVNIIHFDLILTFLHVNFFYFRVETFVIRIPIIQQHDYLGVQIASTAIVFIQQELTTHPVADFSSFKFG